MASFRCYDNSDVTATLIMTNFLSLSNTTVVTIFPNRDYPFVYLIQRQEWLATTQARLNRFALIHNNSLAVLGALGYLVSPRSVCTS